MKHTLAIIGFGGMANWHFENVTKRVPEIKIKGAVDVRPEALEKAESLGLYAYKNVDELMADKEVDIVTIATPNNFHKDLAILAMKNGKNAISEKPVTMNAPELAEIIKARDEYGKLFSVHQNRRWDKDFLALKSVLESGSAGKPYYIESRVEGSNGAMHGWRGHKINGGGMLLDWGVHLIDQMLWMINEKVVSVSASLKNIASHDVDDNDRVYIRFESGLSVQIELYTNCFVQLPRFRAMCEDGTIEITNWKPDGKVVKRMSDEEMKWEDEIVYTEAGPTRTLAPRPAHTVKEFPLPEIESDWADFYKNILGVLDKGAELIVKPEQCLRVMKVIDLAFESEASGKSVSCLI